MKRFTLVGLAVTAAMGLSAMTVEKMVRGVNGDVFADLSYAAASGNRNVVVAWGGSDAGASYGSWGMAEYAVGIAGAGSTQTRVTLPPEAASAARARFFLVPASAAPEYIRSTGKQFVRTDFYPGPQSKIYADYSWEDTTTKQQRIFGVYCDGETGLKIQHYINGSGALAWNYSHVEHWTPFDNTEFKVRKTRAQVTFDAVNRKVTYSNADGQSYTGGMSGNAPGPYTATSPLNILANDFKSHKADPYGAARIYALECWDDGVLQQNFTPYFDGTIAAFRDTVSGKIYDNELSYPFFAGAPKPAVAASETSDAVSPATELAKMQVSSFSAGSVNLSFGASSSVRELWCAWDDTDKGETFGAWANNERVQIIAANATTALARLPPAAIGAKSVRFFVLAAGGSYQCEYIRADGRQAIDTGIITGNGMAVTVDFLPHNLETIQQRLFGEEDMTNGFSFVSYVNGNGFYAWAAKDHVGNWTATGIKPQAVRTSVTIDVPNDVVSYSFAGKEVYRKTISSVVPAANRTIETGKLPLALFAGSKTNGVAYCAQFQMYGATISTNGIPARNYSPCVVNGVAGARDTVTGEFFGNMVTNEYTQFIPGGRKDSPAALAVATAVDMKNVTSDVFSDAKFWLRGFGNDINGDGVLNRGTELGELRDALGRTKFTSDRVYGADGALPRFTNEFVRMPGRGVGRNMQTLYFPQQVVFTNEAKTAGYVHPATINMKALDASMTNRWTFIIRAKPDMEETPANSSQWLVNFGHGGKNGFMIGLNGSGKHSRTFIIYSNGTALTSDGQLSGLVATNGWFDLAVIADGQKLKLMLMRDGDELKGSGGDTISAIMTKTKILDPKFNLKPASAIILGAESSIDGIAPWPMTTNNNNIKAFRGSIQQFAVWDRALSDREVFNAFGWPRTDLWRVGVENDSTCELQGEAPEEGIAADAENWPVRNGVTKAMPLTIKFPLEYSCETNRGQMLRWKSAPGSPAGKLSLAINGRNVGRAVVKNGAWKQWFVDATLLQLGTNTAVLTRVDNGAGAMVPDVIALGGGVQVGNCDLSYSDFIHESYGMKNLYSGDGNLHDVRRVLFCQRSVDLANFWYHVTVPAEMVHNRQRWRFTFGTTAGNLGSECSYHPISIDLNGKTLDTINMGSQKSYSINILPDDIVHGDNVFNFRNNHPDTGAHYLGIDYFAFEPLRPIDATLVIIR